MDYLSDFLLVGTVALNAKFGPVLKTIAERVLERCKHVEITTYSSRWKCLVPKRSTVSFLHVIL